jgi:ubiquitin-protein ligase
MEVPLIYLKYIGNITNIIIINRVTMQCLETGPYRDHIINVIITFDDYPHQSPTVKFVNHIFHPNIDLKTGTIINQIMLLLLLSISLLRYTML